jgi:hypothetical protein
MERKLGPRLLLEEKGTTNEVCLLFIEAVSTSLDIVGDSTLTLSLS